MSRLDNAVRSVPAGTSPANDYPDDANHVDDAETPEPEGHEGADSDDSGEGKPGRTVENVRGEVLRKMEKNNQEMLREIAALREELGKAREQYGVPTAPAADTPKTIEDMSIAELEAMLPSVPDEQKGQFKEYLLLRKAEERAERKFAKRHESERYNELEQKYNSQAMSRWPQLGDRTSELYRNTDRILSEMGKAAENNPRAVLDAANEAGLELGLTPTMGLTPRTPQRTPSGLAPGRSTADGPSKKRDSINMEEMEKVAKGLQNAMPGKKFTKEQLKRIAEREKMYRDTINTRVRG